ncbi:MAG: CotH kinase family protein, partial [Phycisphaerae bacterium]
FRRKYGTRQFLSGDPFSQETDPIKTLVIKRDRYWLFVDAFTLDIARRLGCFAPEVKHAVFFLNGESQGVYSLMEHVSKRQWKGHIGHAHFLYYRYKSHNKKKTIRKYEALNDWAKNRRIKMTRAEADRHINLDNYTRHMLSFIFCGDSDWRQGVAVLDETDPHPKWYWINWDMDHSFKDFKKTSKSGKRWEQQAIDLILKKRGDVRATIFRRLRNESPDYCAYFARITTDLLNHRIDPEYLNTRLDHYRQLGETFGRDNKKSIDKLREYVNNRPDFIRRQMKALFKAGDYFHCSVRGPHGLKFNIDGYPEDYDYRGWYFQDQTIEVRIVGPRASELSHWRVNRQRIDMHPLIHTITSNTTIEPVFKEPIS